MCKSAKCKIAFQRWWFNAARANIEGEEDLDIAYKRRNNLKDNLDNDARSQHWGRAKKRKTFRFDQCKHLASFACMNTDHGLEMATLPYWPEFHLKKSVQDNLTVNPRKNAKCMTANLNCKLTVDFTRPEMSVMTPSHFVLLRNWLKNLGNWIKPLRNWVHLSLCDTNQFLRVMSQSLTQGSDLEWLS